MVQQVRGTIALTGGTGFIGQHLVRALMDDGWCVKSLTRRPDPGRAAPGLVQVQGVLEDPTALRELVTDAEIVIHAGGRITARNTEDFESANVAGTENLVRAAADQPDPPTLIYLSTIAAREPHLSPYAATKREGENRLRQHGGPLRWNILRPPVVYGPGDRQTLQIFRQFKNGFSLQLASEGRFSMIYVDDLVAAILYLVRDSGRNSAIFELDDGHPNGYCWDDVVSESSRKLNRPIRNIRVPAAVQTIIAAAASAVSAVTGKPPVLSRGKINEFAHPDWIAGRNLLNGAAGWDAKIDLPEGVSRTIDWYISEGWL